MSIMMDEQENPIEVGDASAMILRLRERIAELESFIEKQTRQWLEQRKRITELESSSRAGDILAAYEEGKAESAKRIAELEPDAKRFVWVFTKMFADDSIESPFDEVRAHKKIEAGEDPLDVLRFEIDKAMEKYG